MSGSRQTCWSLSLHSPTPLSACSHSVMQAHRDRIRNCQENFGCDWLTKNSSGRSLPLISGSGEKTHFLRAFSLLLRRAQAISSLFVVGWLPFHITPLILTSSSFFLRSISCQVVLRQSINFGRWGMWCLYKALIPKGATYIH